MTMSLFKFVWHKNIQVDNDNKQFQLACFGILGLNIALKYIPFQNWLHLTHVSHIQQKYNDGLHMTFMFQFHVFPPAAVLFWLNYKAAYDNWNEQRLALNKDIHMATKEVVDKLPGIQQTSAQAFSTLFLQLTVNDLGICLPITSSTQVHQLRLFCHFLNLFTFKLVAVDVDLNIRYLYTYIFIYDL